MERTILEAYRPAIYHLETYVLDGKVIKSKANRPEEVTKEQLQERIDNFENIGIHEGENLIIFCNKRTKEVLLTTKEEKPFLYDDNKNNSFYEAVKSGYVYINEITN